MVDESLELIVGPLDRSLPVPIGTQLRGVIQYRISSGLLAKGSRLPSIKELATASGLAPMTVATAYRALQASGLIASRPGAGTFVADTDVEWGQQTDTIRKIEEQVDKLLGDARAVGMSPAELAGILHARAARAPQAKLRPGLYIVMVGLFDEATQAYADDLALYCEKEDRIEAITVDRLRQVDATAETPDLYVSLVSRRREVANLVKRRAPVASISLIPSERTRAALAAINPTARLCIVSAIPEFLALMKPSVMKFVPHLRDVEVALLDEPALKKKLAGCDAVIYTTGGDSILSQVQPGTNAIEYRHIPDPHSVNQVLLPLIAELRARQHR